MPVQTQCSYGDPDGLEFALDGRMYELEYQVVDGDMDPPEYALAGSDLTTQGNTATCMLCFVSSINFIYRNRDGSIWAAKQGKALRNVFVTSKGYKLLNLKNRAISKISVRRNSLLLLIWLVSSGAIFTRIGWGLSKHILLTT